MSEIEMNGSKATIREVYDLLQRMEDKLDRRLEDQERRLRAVERWRYALPPTLALAVLSTVLAAMR